MRAILVMLSLWAGLAAGAAGAQTSRPESTRPKPAAKPARAEPAPVDPYAKARKAQEAYFRRQAELDAAEREKAKKAEGERWLKPSESSKLEKSGFRFQPFGAGGSAMPR